MVKGSQVLGVFLKEKETFHGSAPRLSFKGEESENEKQDEAEPEQHVFLVHHLVTVLLPAEVARAKLSGLGFLGSIVDREALAVPIPQLLVNC